MNINNSHIDFVKSLVLYQSYDQELFSIPGGTFQMGETGVAEPLHNVILSDFYLVK